MSKILTHYTPREWQLIQKHEAHDSAALPNRIRTPAPASESWWYQLRSPRCEGLKSAQHQRNLAVIKDVQERLKHQKKEAKLKDAKERAQEAKLRSITAKSVRSGTKLEQFCVSPRRNPIAIHANIDENGDDVMVQSSRSEPNVLTVTPAMETVHSPHSELARPALSPSKLNVRNGAPAKNITSPKSVPSLATASEGEPMSPRKLARENVSKGPQYTPMDSGVRDHTFSCLSQRKTELESQLNQFPLAPSLAQVAKKAEIEKELRQLDKCLVVYQFPVVMKRHSDPVEGSCSTVKVHSGSFDKRPRPASAKPVKKRREWKI